MNTYIMNATLNGKLMSEILCEKMDIKGIITLDEKGAAKTPEYYDYKRFCEDRNIECIQLETYNLSGSKDRELLEKLNIDLILIASWQRLIPEWLINRCSIGVIGAHGSHEGIERGRGRSPQNWALLTGKEKFSLSIFWIEPGTDNGAIIDTVEFEYAATDTILTSYVKVNLYKCDMILKNIRNGRIQKKEGSPQSTEGLYLPQRTKEDGQIDWNRGSTEIYNFVRALTKPYPGAWTVSDDTEYIIWSAIPVNVSSNALGDFGENGRVISILGDSFLAKCGNGYLLVNECSNFDQISEGMLFRSADYNEQMKTIIDRHIQKYGTPLSGLVWDEIKSR